MKSAPITASPQTEFERCDWRRIGADAFGPAAHVPTMLSPEERQFYLWLARQHGSASGAIVDLGCFAGGSTAYLAEGARQAGHGQHVFAYDRFRASNSVKEDILYPAGVPPFDSTDIEPLARAFLAPWSGAITLCPGKIEDRSWAMGAINLLVVDAAKSVGLADHIAETFFPALVPGRSIIVQQDFLHWKTPWLPVQMELMHPSFVPLAFCARDTLAFRCVAPVTPDVLQAGRLIGRRDSELIAALDAAAQRLAHWGLAPRLATSIAALRRNPHKRRAKDFTRRP